MPEPKAPVTETNVEVDETADNEPSYLTSDQFNKALSSREKAFEKRLAKQQSDFQAILERIAPPSKEEPTLSRTAELEKTVKELSKTLQEKDIREKNDYLDRSTESSLKSHGIDAEFTEHAVAYLKAKNAVRYDSDGNIVVVLNGVEYDDMDAGLAVFAQSNAAKPFRKPSGAKGSGGVNGKSASQTMKETGSLELKRKEKWIDSKEVRGSAALTLDRNSKAALSQLLAKKLRENQ